MGFFGGPNITTRADKISSFSVATAEYGSVVQEILGTTRISGNVIYYDDFTAHEHRETHRTGKGGGGKQTTITYTYTVAVIVGLCEGTIKGIGKVWIGKNIYTYPHSDIQMSLYRGTEDQKPWPYVVSKHPEKALSYPGLAYMAGVIDLGDSANMPSHNFEVIGKLTETGDGIDVNPADYIEYILEKVGFKGVIKGIDNYRAYCKAADLLISSPSDDNDARTAREIINEIAKLTNAYMFWSDDGFKIVAREDRKVGDWEPDRNIIYNLTPDDFLPQSGVCVSYSRKDSSELYNRFSVEFLNRENGYEKETVSYEDTDDIERFGVKQAGTIKAHYIYKKSRAVMLAEAAARKNKYERNKYTFKLGWAFARLEPGDLVTLTDPDIGLNKLPVMIDSLTEDTDGALTITGISRPPAQYGDAQFDVHENERPSIDFNFDPGSIEPPAIFQPDPCLMHNDNEVWIGAYGKSQYWGGCNVWVSNNDTGYRLIGKITSRASIGYLASDISDSAESAEVKINGQLISGTAADAEKGNTLLWCDDESLSYTTATLLGNGNYRLDGLVRGQYNTEPKEHKANTQITRCDDSLLKATFLNSEVNQTVMFKFTSFNVLLHNEQSLSEVPAYYYKLIRRDTRPPDVTTLDCVQLATGTYQFWWRYDYPDPNDVKGFEFRYNQGSNVTWDTAIPLHTGVITEQPFETQALRQGVHTVMIRAVDESGNYSRGIASAIINLGDPLEENVLYKADVSANKWKDVYHNGIVTADGYLTSIDNVAFWTGSDVPHWDYALEQFWKERYNEFYFIYQTVAPASGQMWLKYEINGPARIEYRIIGNGSFWNKPVSAFWDNGFGWLDTSQQFRPYTGKALIKAGEVIQLRVLAPDNAPEASIVKNMQVIIDVPDREEHFENIDVPVEGLELPVKTPDYYTTAVRIDAIQNTNISIARAAVIERNPCFIKLLDINNNPVSANVDITWQGFIKETI